jgi:putative aminopeptidase FrvX
MDPLTLLQELVAIPGPPGQERPVREAITRRVDALRLTSYSDAKGNLHVPLGNAERPKVVVTAHMDEIAMIVHRVDANGSLTVGALGGLFAWKLGEGPVLILGDGESLPGVLSFGSIHTADEASTARKADNGPVRWKMATVFTGLTSSVLADRGVRPGTRVVVHPSQRQLMRVGPFVAGRFLDDRADLVAWLLALAALKDESMDVLFLASAAEEVGGEGALFALQNLRPDVCIALELGPNTPDAPVELTAQPTVWATDGYAHMSAEDGALVARIGDDLELKLQFQALSRGGSDASCAASHGLCGRPITLGLPMENSHGFEIIHPGSMANLAKLTVGLLRELAT